jgi:hypothetical protein
MRLPSLPGLALGLTMLAAGSASAASFFEFRPVRDTTIVTSPAGDLSDARGTSLYIGRTADATQRALLAFDLSSIPAESTIVSASLTVTVTRQRTGGYEVPLHRLLADWGEGSSVGGDGGGGTTPTPGDATWSHTFFDTAFWATPGGDFDPTPSAATILGPGAPVAFTWSSPGLVSDVQFWLDNPTLNFGWILIGDESSARTAKQLGSRESGLATLQPLLQVEVAPIPEPSTLALLAAGLAGVAAATRRRRGPGQ